MALHPVSLDETEIAVHSRDDAKVVIEFRDKDSQGLEAIFSVDAITAVEFGKILFTKGTNLLDQLQAIADAATAWRDRTGRIWYGAKGSDRLTPKGVDTDQGAHSWDELESAYGPLTGVQDS